MPQDGRTLVDPHSLGAGYAPDGEDWKLNIGGAKCINDIHDIGSTGKDSPIRNWLNIYHYIKLKHFFFQLQNVASLLL